TEPWALRSRHVVMPDGGGPRAAAVIVCGERVPSIVPFDDVASYSYVEDVGDHPILPGLLDIHVHINDPRPADLEGFDPATAAAAAGGVTSLVDMPLNSDPVTTTTSALAAKRGAAEGRLRVDCGFFGGLVPADTDQIEPLANGGVLGFKAFLCDS